jgi:hypothetical protein
MNLFYFKIKKMTEDTLEEDTPKEESKENKLDLE